jgi:hypothetical protein
VAEISVGGFVEIPQKIHIIPKVLNKEGILGISEKKPLFLDFK